MGNEFPSPHPAAVSDVDEPAVPKFLRLENLPGEWLPMPSPLRLGIRALEVWLPKN